MNPMKLPKRAATFGAIPAGLALALGLCATPAQAASTSFANAVLADAPNAWWRMSELPGAIAALDASGNANHGSYSATCIALAVAGIGGGDTAARFDGLGSGRIVAATYDGSLMRIYLNGMLDSELAPVLTGGLPFDLTDLGIGNQVDRDRPFNGVVDELAVYGKALSAGQLQAHLAPVPEPSVFALMLAGLLVVAGLARRRRQDD